MSLETPLSTSNRKGRMLAIERWLDKDQQGPMLRANCLLQDTSTVSLSSRPNRLTKTWIHQTALSLVKYVRHIPVVPQTPTIRDKDFLTNSHYSTSRVLFSLSENKDDNTKLRNHVTKHFAKIHMAKRKHRLSQKPQPQNSEMNHSEWKAYPPEELLEYLEKSFAYNLEKKHKEIQKEKVESLSTSVSLLITSIRNHSLFTPNKRCDESILSHINPPLQQNSADNIKTLTGNDDDTVSNRNLSLTNLESIVAKSCLADLSKPNNNESLVGFLIASLSLLMLNLRENVNPFSRDILTYPHNSLQVGGLLSLTTHYTLRNDPVLEGYKEDGYILSPQIMTYFTQAASVYEERIELQTSHLLAKANIYCVPKTPIFSDDHSREKISASTTPFSTQDVSSTELFTPVIINSPTSSNNISTTPFVVNKEENNLLIFDEPLLSPSETRFQLGIRADRHNYEHDMTIKEKTHIDHSQGNEECKEGKDENDTESLSESHIISHQLHVSLDTVKTNNTETNEYENQVESSSSSYSEQTDIHTANISDYEQVMDEDTRTTDIISDMEAIVDEDEATMLEQALALSLAEPMSSSLIKSGRHERNVSNEGTKPLIYQSESKSDEMAHDESNNILNSTPSCLIEDTKCNLFYFKDSSSRSKPLGNENDLPDFPLPPSKIPSYLETLVIATPMTSRDTVKKSSLVPKPFPPSLDPSSLSSFGTLPFSVVLLELLQCAVSTVEHPLSAENVKNIPEANNTNKEKIQKEVSNILSMTCTTNDKTLINDTDRSLCSPSTVVHLLIALLKFVSNQRTHEIQRLFHTYCENNTFEKYREANKILHFESSLSMENENVFTHCHFLRLYSLCGYFAMKCLRLFLQNLPCSYPRSNKKSPKLKQQNPTYPISLSPLACIHLSNSLSSYTTSSISRMCHSLQTALSGIKGYRNISIERDMLVNPLMRESASLWGECVPLLHSTQQKVEDQLHRLLLLCVPYYVENLSFTVDLSVSRMEQAGSKFPWTEAEVHLLHLNSLCRRLRSVDMLECFIDSSVFCNPLYSPSLKGSVKGNYYQSLAETDIPSVVKPKFFLSSILNVVFKTLPRKPEEDECDVIQFFSALFHCCNVKLLLWNHSNNNLTTLNDSWNDDNSLLVRGFPSLSSTINTSLHLIPDESFNFDINKCSSNISIRSCATTKEKVPIANQRASKVWGSVRSRKYFTPMTGIHQWVVKLQQCERGYVSLGVVTAQASTKTFVGGDNYGWGMIGTKALWHNRNKIRGDYGDIFLTGAIILVTLDSDIGTLRFGIWNQSSSGLAVDISSTDSVETFTQPISSLATTIEGGMFVDWGIAFEGLPLNTNIYPAVGLYQRDDEVFLLNCNAETNRKDWCDATQNVSSCCTSLCTQGISYVSAVLKNFLNLISSPNSNQCFETGHILLQEILPSVAASLCFIPPSIPNVSGRFAFALLPPILQCTSTVDSLLEDKNISLLPNHRMKLGRWIIRSTSLKNKISHGSSSSSRLQSRNFNEYSVTLSSSQAEDQHSINFSGKGIGTMYNLTGEHVVIMGFVRGTSVQFLEEWTESESKSRSESSTSSCVVDARLNFDGSQFEGVYKNIQNETSGIIAGRFVNTDTCTQFSNNNESAYYIPSTEIIVGEKSNKRLQTSLVLISSLLSTAIGHLTLILSTDAPKQDIMRHILDDSKFKAYSGEDSLNLFLGQKRKQELIDFVFTNSILSGGMIDKDKKLIKQAVEIVKNLLTPSSSHDENEAMRSKWMENTLLMLVESNNERDICDVLDIFQMITDLEEIDFKIAHRAGGYGSLSSLNPHYYREARLGIISVLLYHSGFVKENADLYNLIEIYGDELIQIWQIGLQIIESSLRLSLFKQEPGTNRRESCQQKCLLLNSISCLLISVSVITLSADMKETLKENIKAFYVFISSHHDITFIKKILNATTAHCVLKYIGLSALNENLSGIRANSSIECTLEYLHQLILGNLNRSQVYSIRSLNQSNNSKVREYYSPTLSGCLNSVQRCFQSQVRTSFSLIGIIIKTLSQYFSNLVSELSITSSIQSLTLVVLTNFIIIIDDEDDYNALIEQTALYPFLNCIFLHGRAMLDLNIINNKKELDQSKVEQSLISQLKDSAIRHSSLTILQCGVSVLHLLLYQLIRGFKLSRNKNFSVMSKILEPFNILKKQICVQLERAASDSTFLSKRKNFNRADLDVKTLLESNYSKMRFAVSIPIKKTLSTNIDYEQNKAAYFMIVHGTRDILKDVLLQRSTFGIIEHQNVNVTCNENYLVHLLDAFISTVSFPAHCGDLTLNIVFIENLIDNICLNNFETKNLSVTLQVQIRVRILRLLTLILPLATPNKTIVKQIFILVGYGLSLSDVSVLSVNSRAASSTCEYDHHLVMSEAVSLLRHLYRKSQNIDGNKHLTWQNIIQCVIDDNDCKNESKGDSRLLQNGILGFYGGVPGRLMIGSYVMLKLSPAILPRMSFPSTSSKFRGVSNHMRPFLRGIQPVVPGGGTEGIITGLCRNEALTGIVSHIDCLSRTCEIILLNRTENKRDLMNKMNEGSSIFHRSCSNVSIRAIREPISNVVCVDEYPLLLDENFPLENIVSGLWAYINKTICLLSSEENQVTNDGDSILDLLLLTSLLRSCSVIFSYSHFLTKALKSNSPLVTRKGMTQLLELASLNHIPEHYFHSNLVCMKGLSCLAEYEARYWHHRGMLANITLRRNSLNYLPRNYFVRKHYNKKSFKKNIKGSSFKEENKVKLKSTKERFSTPPANVGGLLLLGRSSSILQRLPANVNHSDSCLRDVGLTSTNTLRNSMLTSFDEDDRIEMVEDSVSSVEDLASVDLREAAVLQMAELGLPRSWSEYSLRQVGEMNIEAAVHFCLQQSGDMERLLEDDREREGVISSNSSPSLSIQRRNISRRSLGTSLLLRQLVEMGFPSHWCSHALVATGNNVDEALTWILSNGERLSILDEGNNEEEENNDIHDNGDHINEENDKYDESLNSLANENNENVENSACNNNVVELEINDISDSFIEDDLSALQSNITMESRYKSGFKWKENITCPLRSISGQANIDACSMEVSGLSNGGFSSVGTKGVAVTSGKWYYEVVLLTSGCLQIGWADGSFSGHCQADRGDGCGDGPSSWAYDGWRQYRWHCNATEWGCRWQDGDVIGCMADMDNMVISFTMNGQGEELGMGKAFSGDGFRPCGGVYACISFNRKEKFRVVLGSYDSTCFYYRPPPGYKGIGEAVYHSVDEMETLLKEEEVLNDEKVHSNSEVFLPSPKHYLCDFSDCEQGLELFTWQHRYYSSDASVHFNIESQTGRRNTSNSRIVSRGSKTSESQYSSYFNDPFQLCSISVTHRLRKVWNTAFKAHGEMESVSIKDNIFVDPKSFRKKMYTCYSQERKLIITELCDISLALTILYSRKLLLHVIMALSSKFELDIICKSNNLLDQEESARKLWKVIVYCCSAKEWVGEAGVMAMTCETLGLSISSDESLRSSVTQTGIVNLGKISENGPDLLLPAGAMSQVLCTTLSLVHCENELYKKDVYNCLPAFSEAVFGGDDGGSILYLQHALLNALIHSYLFCRVILSMIKQSVRRLSGIEYENDVVFDRFSSKKVIADGKLNMKEIQANNKILQPDPRLISFLTGIILSVTLNEDIEKSIFFSRSSLITESLFESWSIGLLSASAPWRMICALTVSGVLNTNPYCLKSVTSRLPTLNAYYTRLESTVSRRLWAERAAVPICSRYIQAFIELLSSTKKALRATPLISNILQPVRVDSATPLPLEDHNAVLYSKYNQDNIWEWHQNWISSDGAWEIWTGTVEYHAVDWVTPTHSTIRSVMDLGEGPPMLREGCRVVRGPDWKKNGSGAINGNDDGKDTYDEAKGKKYKATSYKYNNTQDGIKSNGKKDIETNVQDISSTVISPLITQEPGKTENPVSIQRKRKKVMNPKLPIGTVVSIEPWKGLPGLGRRVLWHLTGEEHVYRYGGDGGRYDIEHVEVNDTETRICKRYLIPESVEQCASRHGFGLNRQYSVLLRVRINGENHNIDGEYEVNRQGILEWPDFGAGISVDCCFHEDGAITIIEKEMIFGDKDSGWETRFGQPYFVPGSTFVLSRTSLSSNFAGNDTMDNDLATSKYEVLLGSSSHLTPNLRNQKDGGRLRVTSEMQFIRSTRSSLLSKHTHLTSSCVHLLPPIYFDNNFHASSLNISRNRRTVTCNSPEGKGTAFASVGFTKGLHYWELKIVHAEIGSIFIGVAEKSSSMLQSQPRLKRWYGWGFVNYRATYHSGSERVYGVHCHAGDTIGVLLDCDAGRLSFFFDGVKYGEHILNDLGCAFENISPFGFNSVGCGNGGAGQGAPSCMKRARGGIYPAHGSVRPKALWPVVGLQHVGDKVSISEKWMTSYGIDGVTVLQNAMALDEILCSYESLEIRKRTCLFNKLDGKFGSLTSENTDGNIPNHLSNDNKLILPKWFIYESYVEYERWRKGRWQRFNTRGSGPFSLASYGLDIDVDTSPFACASACASLGLKFVLVSGDRVMVKRSAGRILEYSEEAIILGAFQGRLWYRLVTQKSEGGSLTEGGERAWFWDESEVVGDSLQVIGKSYGDRIELPLLDRFKCDAKGGLCVVHSGGAAVQSDLEIFNDTENIGVVKFGTNIPRKDVFERRVNSCGIIRYRIRHDSIGEGWISSRMRGDKEEIIVVQVEDAGISFDNNKQLNEKAGYEINSNYSFSEDNTNHFGYPEESANVWLAKFSKLYNSGNDMHGEWSVTNYEEFKKLVFNGVIPTLTTKDSDSLLVKVVEGITNYSSMKDSIDFTFDTTLSVLMFSLRFNGLISNDDYCFTTTSSKLTGANQLVSSMFSNVSGPLPSVKSLLARIGMLRALNRRSRYALPWLSIRPPQEGSAVMGGFTGFGVAMDRVGKSRMSYRVKKWIKAPSIGSRLRSFRTLFFPSTKKFFIDSVINASTTPTPLSNDEYELPREIRTVRVNRLRARRAMTCSDPVRKRKYSVFSQMRNEINGWDSAALRRGHVAKGHGGQKRAFKVKLVGEGVNDYSGPYREVFTDVTREIVNICKTGNTSLGILEPSPNNFNDVGDNRNLFVFAQKLQSQTFDISLSAEESIFRAHFASCLCDTSDNIRSTEDSLIFLGKLTGIAYRHGLLLDLPLPLGLVWKRLTEEDVDDLQILREIDLVAYRQIKNAINKDTDDAMIKSYFVYQQVMLNNFAEGMACVLPLELFAIFNGSELRDMICGNPECDIDLLQRVVEYVGYNKDDDVISYFWDSLREMTDDQRKLFLQFVWARSRLPLKESDFNAPFKIHKDINNPGGDSNSAALPSATTCFFTLSLPEYNDKETLKKKLLFAITNVTTMEMDYVTNDSEVGEGWRGS